MSDIQPPRDLSIGEQRFTELRQEQLVYVDKTAFVAKLVRKAGSIFFLVLVALVRAFSLPH